MDFDVVTGPTQGPIQRDTPPEPPPPPRQADERKG